jgi:hypothetical protein
MRNQHDQEVPNLEVGPVTKVLKGNPIYTLIWQFSHKADGQMKVSLCFPGHCQWKSIKSQWHLFVYF